MITRVRRDALYSLCIGIFLRLLLLGCFSLGELQFSCSCVCNSRLWIPANANLSFLLFTVALESHKEKEKLRANKLVMDVIALIMVVLPHFPAVALILMFKDRHDFLLNRIYV